MLSLKQAAGYRETAKQALNTPAGSGRLASWTTFTTYVRPFIGAEFPPSVPRTLVLRDVGSTATAAAVNKASPTA